MAATRPVKSPQKELEKELLVEDELLKSTRDVQQLPTKASSTPKHFHFVQTSVFAKKTENKKVKTDPVEARMVEDVMEV